MLSTPLICASMGAATESASVFESAPGYVADTVTWTGVMVGYCWTGSTTIETSPAMHRMIETTAAKIGRSMKKRENMGERRLLPDGKLNASCLLVAAAAGDVDRRLQVHAVGGDALGDQRVAHGERTPLGELDVGAAIAGPVREPRHVDRIRARLDRRRESLEQPDSLGIESRLAGGEMNRQRRAGRNRDRRGLGSARLRNVGRRLARRVGREPQAAVDDDLIAGGETLRDEPRVAVPVADLHRTLLRLACLVDDPDEVAACALLDGALRNEDRVRADGADEPRANVLVRPQDPVGIVDGGADQEGAGLRIVRRIGERDPPLVREDRAVDELDLDDEAPILRETDQARLRLVANALHLV